MSKEFCAICPKALLNESNMHEHLNGKPHTKKCENRIASNPNQEVTCYKCEGSIRIFQYTEHMKNNCVTPMPSESSQETHSNGRQCTCCNTVATSDADANIHAHGNRHRLNACIQTLPDNELPPVVRDFPEMQNDHCHYNKLRPYQRKLLTHIMSTTHSSICFLPPGCGKSLVASVFLNNMLNLNPQRVIFFVATRDISVLQHFKLLTALLGPEIKIGCICGEVFQQIPKDLHDCKVLVITASRLIKMLKLKALSWNRCSLVVFDDVYTCEKNHFYRQLLDDYHKPLKEENFKPFLLGLATSPRSSSAYACIRDQIKNCLKLFDNAPLWTVGAEDDTMKQYVPNYEVHYRIISPSNVIQDIVRALNKSSLTYLEFNDKQIKVRKELFDILQMCKKTETEFLSTDITTKVIEHKQNGITWEYLEEAVDICNVHSNDSAISKFLYFLKSLSNLFSLLHIIDEKQAISSLQEVISTKNEVEHLKFHQHLEALVNDLQKAELGPDSMFKSLVKLVIEKAESLNTILIIANTFEVARHLHRLFVEDKTIKDAGLDEIAILSNPKCVLNKQKWILFSTTEVHDSVTIPNVDLLISLNPSINLSAFVPLRGRSVHHNCEFHIFLTNAKSENLLRQLQRNEENLRKVVNLLANK